MARRTKVLIFVILVGVLSAVISYFKVGEWNVFTILQAGLIATVLNILLVIYDHYGWRAPLLRYFATSPNLRGTWEFENPKILSITKLVFYEHLKGGYLSIQQSDSHIKINIIWSDDEPSELRIDSPVSTNQDRCAFSGSFIEHPSQSNHGFGAFIMFGSLYPAEFVLRYRTDHGVTGKILAKNRKPWHIENKNEAVLKTSKIPSLLDKIKFLFQWT